MKPITSGQRDLSLRVSQDTMSRILREEDPNADAAQRFLAKGDEFREGVRELYQKLSASEKYGHEKTNNRCYYGRTHEIKPLLDQFNALEYFFGVSTGRALGTGAMVFHLKSIQSYLYMRRQAEGLFLIPRWQLIADTYSQALSLIFCIMRNQFPLDIKLNSSLVVRKQETQDAFEKIGESQKGYPYLVIPAQLGKRHGGRSTRSAIDSYTGSEFGLGLYELGCILLTHPNLLDSAKTLFVRCPGDQYESEIEVPYYVNVGGGYVRMNVDSNNSNFNCQQDTGLATGFIPLNINSQHR